jgi:hypothetical protein
MLAEREGFELEPSCWRERGEAERERAGEILSEASRRTSSTNRDSSLRRWRRGRDSNLRFLAFLSHVAHSSRETAETQAILRVSTLSAASALSAQYNQVLHFTDRMDREGNDISIAQRDSVPFRARCTFTLVVICALRAVRQHIRTSSTLPNHALGAFSCQP